jgi:hypothetical protein
MKVLHQFKESNKRNTMKRCYTEKLPILSQREYLQKKRDGLVDDMERDFLRQIQSSLEGVASDSE